ncbi:MAG: TIGR01777 family protein, partial [Gemmatimonadetes bacterium]
SRVLGTGVLARALAGLDRPPPVLVSASAVGYYGDRGNEICTEESGPGKGFLAEVVKAWEAAAAPAARAGIRVVNARIGVVLSAAGGALAQMLLPFQIGIGGRLGGGKQYVSWVDADDVLGLLLHAVRTPGMRGPMNVTAPLPVTNAVFTNTLGRVLGRPTVVPVPGFALKALFGEMATELLLHGQRVRPAYAEASGYEFLFSTLEDSLRFQLGRERPEGADAA